VGLLQDLGAYSNPFGAPSTGIWNLCRGTFINANLEAVVFFYDRKTDSESPGAMTALDQTMDGGGRRLAVYEYPYREGQQVADLGRKGVTFTFNIKFFGQNYQEKFREFTAKVINVKGQGALIHPTLSPVFGAFNVRFKDFEFIHRYDEWNAITIKAVFIEDNLGDFDLSLNAASQTVSTDSALRQGLQGLVSLQAGISQAISDVSALLILPGAIVKAMNNRLTSIVGQASRLMGQLGATFSSDNQLHSLSQSSLSVSGGVSGLTSGTAVSSSNGGKTALQELPPVFQVGFDPTTQNSIQDQIDSFVNASQVTVQQALFSANQSRGSITDAITEAETNMGNYSYDIVLQYREMAVTIQSVVEAAIASAQSKVKLYVTEEDMSLRQVAFRNGLAADRVNDIADLNPYIGSINYVPRGTTVTVPAA
jgi:DNA circularisation protein N-terminus